MKTSNKILIAFATSLILIPILGMVYVSQVNFKDGKDVVDVVYKNNHFKAQSPNMVSTAISTPFTSVNIKDAKGYYVNIRLIEDKDYGVKVQDRSKDTFKFEVDANGQLQISLADKAKESNYYGTIIIYAPKIKALMIAKADGIELNVNLDSLNLSVASTGNISFSSTTKINALAITANDVTKINMEREGVKALNLNLTNTHFTSSYTSFDNLVISTNSLVTLAGSEDEKDKYIIKNLAINTNGNANLKLENIKVLQCSGSFSDETKVEMPAINLNQMFKK